MYIQAVLSSEDANHFRQTSGEEVGVNTQGVARAILDKIFNQGVSGGSTIDMQAAKNLATSFSVRGDVNILRKLLEWGIAESLLDKLTPEQIFASYVNVISYGKVEGVKPAARLLFDKKLEDLTLPEMALLAILPKNPNGQGLWSHSAADNWADNASALVRRMNENGYIHDSQKIAAQLEIYKFTHIDTKQDDLNFLKNHLNLNSDQFDRIKILANQYDQIEFQDRFIDITTSTREVSRNHTPMPISKLPDGKLDTKISCILVDKGFFSGSDESYIRASL
jgi:membrane peptidoglycan carboxypeptidase